MRGTGGRFQIIHGVYEQQDFSKGLKAITATDAAFSPLNIRRGDMFSPSQVCMGGNSRKSSETIRRSITRKTKLREHECFVSGASLSRFFYSNVRYDVDCHMIPVWGSFLVFPSGIIHSLVLECGDAPRQGRFSNIFITLEILTEFAGGFTGFRAPP